MAEDTYAVQAHRWMAAQPEQEAGWTVTEVAKGIGHPKSQGAVYNALRSLTAQPFGPFAPGTAPVETLEGEGKRGYGRRFRLTGTRGHTAPVSPMRILQAFASTAGPKSAQALAGTLQVPVQALKPTLDDLVSEGILRTGPYYRNGFQDRRRYYSWVG